MPTAAAFAEARSDSDLHYTTTILMSMSPGTLHLQLSLGYGGYLKQTCVIMANSNIKDGALA